MSGHGSFFIPLFTLKSHVVTCWLLISILICLNKTVLGNTWFDSVSSLSIVEAATPGGLTKLDVVFSHILLDSLIFAKFTTSWSDKGSIPGRIHVCCQTLRQ